MEIIDRIENKMESEMIFRAEKFFHAAAEKECLQRKGEGYEIF